MFDDFCCYLEEIYNGNHFTTINPLGYKLLWIVNGDDIFYINLSDKLRYSDERFTLWHQNRNRKGYHKQRKAFHLAQLIIEYYTHGLKKICGIYFTKEDDERLVKDYQKYIYR